MPPYTIGYYDESASQGGTTRYLLELLAGLDRERFAPVLFALDARAWHEDARELGADVVTLRGDRIRRGAANGADVPPVVQEETPENKSAASVERTQGGKARRVRMPRPVAWTAGQMRDGLRLKQLFEMRRVDLLHTNNTGPEWSPIGARLAGVKRVVGTWHVDSTYDLKGERQSRAYRLLEDASMRALHHAIAVSEDTRQDWLRRCRLNAAYQERVEVIYNGINAPPLPSEPARATLRADFRARHGLPLDALVIGSLGRLMPAKGYEYLIRACAELRPACPDAYLALAGSGPNERALRRLAGELGMAQNTLFMGFVQDTFGFLACLDIYAQPSLCEALGIGILEASAMQLPVVASKIGGIPEAILADVTGRLVPARDPSALADALCGLLHSPALRLHLGREGRARVLSQFTRGEMVRRTAAVYERILTSTPCR